MAYDTPITAASATADPYAGMTSTDYQKMIEQLLTLLQQTGGGKLDALSQRAMLEKLAGAPSGGAVGNPLAGSTMMAGATPSTAGPVQWLGGMPPGYDDKVARKLSYAANAGNLGAGDVIMGGLNKLLGLFGGGGGR